MTALGVSSAATVRLHRVSLRYVAERHPSAVSAAAPGRRRVLAGSAWPMSDRAFGATRQRGSLAALGGGPDRVAAGPVRDDPWRPMSRSPRRSRRPRGGPGLGRRRSGLVLGWRGRRPRDRLAAPPDDDARPCAGPPGRAGGSAARSTMRSRPPSPGRPPDPATRRSPGRARTARSGTAPGRARRGGPGGRQRARPSSASGEGDRVGIFLPMLPETAIAVLALGGSGDLHADLLAATRRRRSPRGCATARRSCSSPPTASTGAARWSAQGDRRRGGRRGAVGRSTSLVVRRAGQRRSTCRWTPGRDALVADSGAAGTGRRPPTDGATDRPRDAVHGHLHLGHDRPAEGRGPRPRRLPDQGARRTSPTASTSARATRCSGSPTSAG